MVLRGFCGRTLDLRSREDMVMAETPTKLRNGFISKL